MVKKTSKLSSTLSLKINANIIKYYIEKYIKNNNMTYISTKNNDHDNTKFISYSSSYISITKLIELIINDIIDNTLTKCKKNDIGLNILSYDDILSNITVNNELRQTYYKYIFNYDHLLNYTNIIAPFDYIKDYIDLEYPASLMLDYQTTNFISYLVVSIVNELLNIMYLMIKYAKKSYFTPNTLLTAISIIFRDPLKTKLLYKLEEINTSYVQYKSIIKKSKSENQTEKVTDQQINDNNKK